MLNFYKLLGTVYNRITKFSKLHGIEFLKLGGMMGIFFSDGIMTFTLDSRQNDGYFFFRWHHDIYAGFLAE